ncbi:MAG: hypoxanthine phosphoribosyltransferase [Candidatus Gastranaerophilales bacterium]|nr:hypoxanthine phosphoribosyltransferase [Candidatus Gastranaerophilales bacterium]
MDKDIKDLKVLIDNQKLISRIKELAHEINIAYGTSKPLTLICVLRGAVMFFTELSKYLEMPVKMEFVSLSSYGDGQKSSGKIKTLNLNLPNMHEENVLIVEDIVDTGLTLDFLIKFIKMNCCAQDVKLAVLFDKKCARKYDVTPDFSAFEIDDKFIVGFGLDYTGLYRNLDYVGYFP